jgi:hypothetical protein
MATTARGGWRRDTWRGGAQDGGQVQRTHARDGHRAREGARWMGAMVACVRRVSDGGERKMSLSFISRNPKPQVLSQMTLDVVVVYTKVVALNVI